MIRFSFSVLFILITSVLIVTGQLSTKHSIAQDAQSTVSGRVINQNGEPIVDITLSLSNSISKTDSDGQFTFLDVPSSEVQLRILEQNVIIETIKIGKVTLYNNVYTPLSSFPFIISPGTNINNVEVITRNLLNKRGRIIFKNGDPLADESLNISVDGIGTDIPESYSSNRSIQTDGEGYFEFFIYRPGVYTLSVNHRGLSAEIDPFLFLPEAELATQVLKLNGNLENFSEPPPELSPDEPDRRRNVSDIPGMWIINPANGHAYKRINCKNRVEAQAQAEEENAYLVTITSEQEQIWLEAAFGKDAYWIGITDIVKEGKWLWENGEPVRYTNWGKFETDDDLELISGPPAFLKFFGVKDGRERHEEEIQDFAILTFSGSEHFIGKWIKVGPRHVGRVRMAIIEKKIN